MLDRHRIKTRIEKINGRLRILNKEFKPLGEKELVSNEGLNAAAERHLEVAIQACLDIANHIVSSLGLKRPSSKASEVFLTLAEEGIIPKELAERLAAATGYRNILAHEYLEVDRHLTYLNIQDNLPDLAQFAKYIEGFLEKKS